jgi:hypothetical protein
VGPTIGRRHRAAPGRRSGDQCMGVLKHEHLSPAGMTIATMLREQIEDL